MTRRGRGCLPCFGASDRTTANERTPLLAGEPQETALGGSRPIERLAAAFGALRAGSLPSNAQLSDALRCLLRTDLLRRTSSDGLIGGGLSGATERLLGDARDVIEAALALLEAKNGSSADRDCADNSADDALAELIFHLREARVSAAPALDVPGASRLPDVSPAEARDDAAESLDAIVQLLRFGLGCVFDSSRGILDDVSFLLRSALADAADDLASRAGDAAESLRPDADDRILVDAQADARDVQRGARELKDAATTATASLVDAGSALAEVGPSVAERTAAEAQDVVIQRLQRFVDRLRTDPAGKRALDSILSIIGKWIDAAARLGEAATEAVDGAQVTVEVEDEDRHGAKALEAARKLVEAWTGRPLTPLLDACKLAAEDVQTNEKLRAHLGEWHAFALKLLDDPDWASSRAAGRRAEELVQTSQQCVLELSD